jgi:hypothetical protein
MRYALRDLERSTEVRFKTLKELWAHVRCNDLCSEETDIDDVVHTRRLLSPRFDIHDFDTSGLRVGRRLQTGAAHRLMARARLETGHACRL